MIEFYLIQRRIEYSTIPPNITVPLVKDVASTRLNVIENNLQTFRFEVEEEGFPFSLRVSDFTLKAWDNGEIHQILSSFDETQELLLLEIIDTSGGMRHLLVVQEIKQDIEPSVYEITAVGGIRLLSYLQSESLNLEGSGWVDLAGFLAYQIKNSSEFPQPKLYLNVIFPVEVIGYDGVQINMDNLRALLTSEENKNKIIDKFEFIRFLAKQLNAVMWVDNGKFYFVKRNLMVRDLNLDLENILVGGKISKIYNRRYNGIATKRVIVNETKTNGSIITSWTDYWVIATSENDITAIPVAYDVTGQEHGEQLEDLRRKGVLLLWDLELKAFQFMDVLKGVNLVDWKKAPSAEILGWQDILWLVKPYQIAEVEVAGLDFNVLDRVRFRGMEWNVWRVEKDFSLEISKLLLYSVREIRNYTTIG